MKKSDAFEIMITDERKIEMVFSSFEFICWFLPCFLLIYYLTPFRWKNACILLFSLVFYAHGTADNPEYVLLIVISLIVNYALGIFIGRSKVHKKPWLVLGLIYNFGILFVFKYLDFVIGNLNNVLHNFLPEMKEIQGVNLVLPIGISFFTFQIVSYLIDVYRGTVKEEYGIVTLGTYILMFPQLIAGPIVRFEEVREKLWRRRHSLKGFLKGLRTFIIGLGFKVLLANRIGLLWNDVTAIGSVSISTPLAWMGIVAYSLQLYFDFYGYSLMAMGLGRMMGISIPHNFKTPYMSCSMTQFWRRWHITLGAWFREYVYIPLGGNRRGKARTIFNLFVVWLLTGIWHGADWNFFIWGIFLFAVMAVERLGVGKWLEEHKIAGHAYMLLLIPVSWLIFAISDLKELGTYFGRLVGIGGEYVFKGDFAKYWGIYGRLLIVGIIFCTPFPAKIYKKIEKSPFVWLLLAAILGGVFYFLYMGLNDPFLYFRF